jgi:predicted transcriptional regulator of viral defense system
MHELAMLVPDGAAARHEVTLASSVSSVKRWTTAGDLVSIHPGVVMLPHLIDDRPTRARAAALWAKGPVSHVSALELWGVVGATGGPIHVTVPADRFPRRTNGVLVHRTTLELPVSTACGVQVTSLPRSLVDAWDWSHRKRRGRPNGGTSIARQAVIECVRSRQTALRAVREASEAAPVHAGRAELTTLLDLIAGGCESELEIWGATTVLPGPPDLPPWIQQYRVRLGDGRLVRLDAAYPEARVAVELDGAAFHGSRQARERDLRRDTALAALGWVVLRFSYARLMADPEGCRREIAAVVRARLANR